MSDRRFAIIDPAAGISGDMLLGALLSAGAPREWLETLPARLGCPEVTIEMSSVFRSGIQATKVDVRLPGGRQEHPAEAVHGHDHTHSHDHGHHRDHDHPHHHGHEHGHAHEPHRHIGELIAMIQRAELSPTVRERAVQAFRLLGEAEGRVHGLAAEDVLLHEVGALDALIDIVGGIEGFERLNIERIYHQPVALGSGWVRAAHGIMPVPAPATAILLEGIDVAPNGPVEGEATTPTGAVLLRVLSSGPPPSGWRLVGSGWGAGGRDPGHYPNALRLLVAESALEAGQVMVLSTDIDDLSPEYVAPLQEAAFGAGALDVQLWTTHAKKGRVSLRLEVITTIADADRVSRALFQHSTTAGIRRQIVERLTLPRREMGVEAADGTVVRVKVLDGPDGVRVKPEFEDVLAVARRTGQAAHEVARDMHERAVRLLRSEG
jgi:pyridinium-3,5-bisthiocarboxylic acid mononucleotide nickel chelatase